MVNSAVVLLRERGVSGVTVEAVLEHSGAPRGSVYHHFPGGRAEMLSSAVLLAGDFISGLLEKVAVEGSPQAAFDQFVGFWKQAMVASDHLAGCPIVAVAVDTREELADVVRETFDRWREALRDSMVRHGFPADTARRRATLLISAVEGAIILCRAQRDSGPLDDVRQELGPLLEL
ncbi:TetR/AcrR family transcriptional regulator [Pseudonocardiaceae bacterium YIM PH 21723]|nr:TetR/AcrR family transcriptional regulator [Pseudonocardiaceae bacterium YIM PH 21723]